MTESVDRQLLQIEEISKGFAGVQALNKVSLSVSAGEIHALLGENGAGKSTLIKVLTGVYRRDHGRILLNQQEINARDAGHAQQLGISTVYQEVNLIPTLTVTENLTLLHQDKKFGLISWRSAEKIARQMLQRVGLDIDPSRQLDSYSVAVQQLIAIARAIGTEAKLLILDEPTASLDSREIERLFRLMRQLKDQGMGIIFVTHFLDQVYEVTDRISVLRNGEHVGTYITAELPRDQLISAMIGKTFSTESGRRSAPEMNGNHKALLETAELGKHRFLNPISLSIASGEIVGLAGLLGSGRTELCDLVFGSHHADHGEIRMHGERRDIHSPRQAIRNNIGYCPEDRKHDGIVAELSVRENMILALQASRGWWSSIPMAEQKQLVEDMIARLAIKTPDMDKPIGELSGGNQQKVILARWLITHPEILILDEPTRGIDVGAHHEIIQIMKELCDQGMGLMVASSELEELVAFASRVVVLRDRKKVAELTGEEISQRAIVDAIAQ